MAVRYQTINEHQAGQRLDNFLITLLKGVPKTHIYRLIRKGEVRVNKKRAEGQTRLAVGDEVRIPPVRVPDAKERTVASTTQMAALLDTIIFEDEYLLVLNKPAGFAVHGGSGVSFGVIECLRQAKPYTPFLELAHRLDRLTSGCLLIAKKRAVLLQLQDAWQAETTQKTYLALVHGIWPKRLNKVELALATHERQDSKRHVVTKATGKASVTIFTRQAEYAQASLVKAELRTGRMHQIRVHASAMEHPIIGDPDYGDPARDKVLLGTNAKGMYLHAHELRFIHPATGQKCSFTAPLPPNWDTLITKL